VPREGTSERDLDSGRLLPDLSIRRGGRANVAHGDPELELLPGEVADFGLDGTNDDDVVALLQAHTLGHRPRDVQADDLCTLGQRNAVQGRIAAILDTADATADDDLVRGD
jgi:hypothetical protein